MISSLVALVLAGSAVCEPAPEAVRDEVERLLHSAAAHATSSQACIDGPGHKVKVELKQVCRVAPGVGPGRLLVRARYVVTATAELGMVRGCKGNECTPTSSTTREEQAFEFARISSGEFVIQPPPAPEAKGAVRALDFARLYEPHDAGCYGKVPAFVPNRLALDAPRAP